MKRQEWLRKDRKTEKKERKVKKRRVKMKEKAKTFGALRIIYYFCRCYENRHYYSITRDAGRLLQRVDSGTRAEEGSRRDSSA